MPMTLVEPEVELLMSGSQSPGHHRKQCVTEGHRKQSVTEGHRKPSVTEGHRKPYGPYVTIMAYIATLWHFVVYVLVRVHGSKP